MIYNLFKVCCWKKATNFSQIIPYSLFVSISLEIIYIRLPTFITPRGGLPQLSLFILVSSELFFSEVNNRYNFIPMQQEKKKKKEEKKKRKKKKRKEKEKTQQLCRQQNLHRMMSWAPVSNIQYIKQQAAFHYTHSHISLSLSLIHTHVYMNL